LGSNGRSASQEFPYLLWNHVHRSQPLVPILTQMNPLNFPPYFPKIQANIIFLSMPGSSELSLSFRFSIQNPVRIFISSVRATYPVHLILLDFVTLKVFGEVYKL